MLSQSRLYGGLMVVAGLLFALFCLAYGLSSTGTSGGLLFVGGFIIIVSVPLIAGGVFFFLRGQQEEQLSAQITQQRKTLESESLARSQLADRVDQERTRLQGVLNALTASNPTSRLLLEDAITRLNNVGSALRRTSYERVGAFEPLAADSSDADTVRSIDAALDSGARALDQQVSALTQSLASGQPDGSAIAQLNGTISRLENAVNERSRVITSGEQKALPTVDELLRGVQPMGVAEPEKFTQLKPGDAISYAGEDYLVSGRLVWTEGARQWETYLLSGGQAESWLMVEQGGTKVSIMHPIQNPAATGNTLTVQGTQFTLAEQGTATVTVTGASGSRGGLFVGYRKYAGTQNFVWIEEWDEGPKAMLGTPDRPEMFDLYVR